MIPLTFPDVIRRMTDEATQFTVEESNPKNHLIAECYRNALQDVVRLLDACPDDEWSALVAATKIYESVIATLIFPMLPEHRAEFLALAAKHIEARCRSFKKSLNLKEFPL